KPHTAAAAKENRGERSGRYELSSRRIAPHRPATPARCPHSSSALPNRVAAGREAIGFVALASVVARRGGAAAATVRGMSFGGASSVAAGGKRPFEYGRTHVVRPKGAHKATIVWLHGLGDNGASSWSQLLETLPLPNIKWICPTAPTRPVAIFGGFPSTAWFDVADLSEDSPDDVEGLDSSAAHVVQIYCLPNLQISSLALVALVWVLLLRFTPVLALLMENMEMAILTL
uniref:Phospholipase/carboxylesterase/thioesterase domain-containing protein n=2 Tax=Aegilops tauschii subsp. strangulata TaxID=200361 RepID=A0A453EB09_AEGTS